MYYYFVKYRTDETHHFVTPKGDENCAITTVFELDEDESFGVCMEPEMVLSITGRAQGMCVIDDNTLVLSTSGGFMGAQLRVYDYKAALDGEEGKFKIGDKEIPVYYLDSGNLINTIEILPKGEGVTMCEDRLFVVFESASTRFKFGKFLECQYVYSVLMERVIKGKEN